MMRTFTIRTARRLEHRLSVQATSDYARSEPADQSGRIIRLMARCAPGQTTIRTSPHAAWDGSVATPISPRICGRALLRRADPPRTITLRPRDSAAVSGKPRCSCELANQFTSAGPPLTRPCLHPAVGCYRLVACRRSSVGDNPLQRVAPDAATASRAGRIRRP